MYITELIVEGKYSLDELPEPYLFLVDDELDRLLKAINIVATKKGYRVVSHSVDAWNKTILVLMKKEKEEEEGRIRRKSTASLLSASPLDTK